MHSLYRPFEPPPLTSCSSELATTVLIFFYGAFCSGKRIPCDFLSRFYNAMASYRASLPVFPTPFPHFSLLTPGVRSPLWRDVAIRASDVATEVVSCPHASLPCRHLLGSYRIRWWVVEHSSAPLSLPFSSSCFIPLPVSAPAPLSVSSPVPVLVSVASLVSVAVPVHSDHHPRPRYSPPSSFPHSVSVTARSSTFL